MNTDKHLRKYLKDYQPPDFSISETQLEFHLEAGCTRVLSRLKMQRMTSDQSAPLVLDGIELNLLELRLDGTPAAPGYTYSYVLEAWDKAGNQRRFVGDGFALPAYRRDDATGPEFLVSGAQWRAKDAAGHGPSALVMEAANWFNLRCEPTRPIRVIATHRTVNEAAILAGSVSAALAPLVGGDPGRVVVETRTETGAPRAGTLHLTARPARNPPAGDS